MGKRLSDTLSKIIEEGIVKDLIFQGWQRVPYKQRHSFSQVQCFLQAGENTFLNFDVQRDKYWTNETGKFTINLGIYDKKYEEFIAGMPLIFPSICSMTYTKRLAEIKYGRDVWYVLNGTAEVNDLQNEVKEDFIKYGLNWYGQVKDLETLIKLLKADWKRVAFGMLTSYGRIEEAKEVFKEILYNRPWNPAGIITNAENWGVINKNDAMALRSAVIQSNEEMKIQLDDIFQRI